MTVNDNTKRVVFVAIAVVLLLSVILPLVSARLEEHRAVLNTSTMKSLWLAGKIIHFLIQPVLFLWVALIFYSDWLREKIDRVEQAVRMKIIVSVIWWLTIAILILFAMQFLLVLYHGSDRIVFATIRFVLFSLLFGCFLLFYFDISRYFHTHTLCNVVASCLLEQHDKFVKANNFDKAYTALLKACETDPKGVYLWCKLALFCERNRKNSAEADSFLAKANELMTTNKANNIGDRACYLDFLGIITYLRGECNKGLEYIKQAIDIEPKPFRIKTYEELLSYSKDNQSDSQNHF